MRHAGGGRRARAPVDPVLSHRDDFLLFDIEVAFLYPWALALRSLGWPGYMQVVLFTLVLMTGYIYIWKKGALDWSHH